MHPTAAFRHGDAVFSESMIRQITFASVFMTTPDGPRVAHTPVVLTEAGYLKFHLARTNAIVKHIDGAIALAVFQGPDSYISARWYAGNNQVPTWNYIAFELEGRVSRMDEAELPTLLKELSASHEARISSGTPWTMDKIDKKALNALLRGIVGFTMRVESIRETVKLSQNKDSQERERVIDGLLGEGRTDMAALMREISK